MPRDQRTITADDLLPLDQYEAVRAEKKQEALARKKLTSLAIGPNATAIFETWDSMWLQIQEMLRIERGGAEQVADELDAYDPMVPKGRELTMTLFFEVEDPVRRDAFLCSIGGVEEHIFLQIGARKILARPEGDVERTRESDNKTSAVHFLHFDLTDEDIAQWRDHDVQAMMLIDHPAYGHAAIITAESRAFLTKDCF